MTEFLLAYICAVLHETSHIMTAHCLKVKLKYMEIKPFGVCAVFKSNIENSAKKEILIALSGPFSNAFLAFICYCAKPILLNTSMLNNIFVNPNHVLDYFILCNVSMAVVNLMPIYPLDGGRILHGCLSVFTGSYNAYRLTLKLSKIPTIAILAVSIYGLLTLKFNFSLIMISVFLLNCLTKEDYNLYTKGTMDIFNLSAHKTNGNASPYKVSVSVGESCTPARFILKSLNTNKRQIIHVIDENNVILGTLTDTYIIKSLSEKGAHLTLKDLL